MTPPAVSIPWERGATSRTRTSLSYSLVAAFESLKIAA